MQAVVTPYTAEVITRLAGQLPEKKSPNISPHQPPLIS
jgi:hypothetical protein